ncbi:restriction endonuclease subunit S [Achromobacter spanius]|uniref:restriction endonuclease subunit S n=1 Tax=Achromobacter spanius TaxID=217203 RepID=UPI0036E3E38A
MTTLLTRKPLWAALTEKDIRAGQESLSMPLLSVSKKLGIVRYSDLFPDRVVRADDHSHYKVVEPREIVLNKMSAATGAVGYARERGMISPDYAVFETSSDCDFRFITYVLASDWFCKNEVQPRLQGIGVGDSANVRTPRVGIDSYLSARVFLPPLDTQRTIADYLDFETGEIDAMITKMDQLAETLLLRRSAVIEKNTTSRSGSFTRMKFCGDVSLGKTVQGEQKHKDELFVNYVRAASIQLYGLELDDQRMWMTQAELKKYDLLKDDVLIVEGGAGYGRSVVLSEGMPEWGFQNHVIRVRPNRRCEGRFLDYCVKGHYSGGLISLLADGATIPGLSSEKVRDLPVPVCSLEEQRGIVEHLDKVTGRIGAMLAKVASLKGLLIERRAALITDVVTGRKEVARWGTRN